MQALNKEILEKHKGELFKRVGVEELLDAVHDRDLEVVVALRTNLEELFDCLAVLHIFAVGAAHLEAGGQRSSRSSSRARSAAPLSG